MPTSSCRAPRGSTACCIDWTGALLLSGALALLLLGVTQAPQLGWGSPANLGLLAGGVALLVAWVRVEQAVDQPLIQLAVLRHRAVLATNVTGLLTGLAMFTGFLLIPQIAQTPASTSYGLGASVTVAGLLLAPSALGQLVAGPVAGRIGVRTGFRATLVVGSLLDVAAFGLLAALHDAWWHLAAAGCCSAPAWPSPSRRWPTSSSPRWTRPRSASRRASTP